MTHPGGRPRLYNTPEEMQPKIDEYFRVCDTHTEEVIIRDRDGSHIETVIKPARYTIPGLAYHLGFETRHSVAQYARLYPEFYSTINKALLKIESQRVNDLTEKDTRNANGIKFDLTNNFDYKDSQNIDHTTNGKDINHQDIDISTLSEEQIAALREAIRGTIRNNQG